MKLKHCYLGNTQKLIPQDWVKGDAKITLIIANLFPNASFLVTLYKLTIQYLPPVYQIFVFSNVPTKVNLEQLSNISKTSGALIFFFHFSSSMHMVWSLIGPEEPNSPGMNSSLLTLTHRQSQSAQEQAGDRALQFLLTTPKRTRNPQSITKVGPNLSNQWEKFKWWCWNIFSATQKEYAGPQ